MDEEKESFRLEDAFEQLNQLIARLEAEKTTLEEAFSLYEEGMKLTLACQQSIDTVEKKVRILSETHAQADMKTE